MPTGPAKSYRRRTTGDGTCQLRSGSQPRRRDLYVEVQQQRRDHIDTADAVHGGPGAQSGRLHARHGIGLRHASLLGQERTRDAEAALCLSHHTRR